MHRIRHMLFALLLAIPAIAAADSFRAPLGEGSQPAEPTRDVVFQYMQQPDLQMVYGMSSGFDAEIADDIPAEFAGQEIQRVILWLGQWFSGPSGPWPDPTGIRVNFYHEFCPPELDPFRSIVVAWADLEKALVYNGSSRRVFEVVVELDPALVLEEGMSLGATALIDWGTAEPFAGICATPFHVSYGACPAYLDGDNWGYTRWTAIDHFTNIPQDLGYAIEGLPTASPPAPLAGPTLAAYPNPFNPRTTLRGVLGVAGHASLRILDVGGRVVTTLFEGWREPGELSVAWNGLDANGETVSAGVYLAALNTPEGVFRSKLVILK